MLPKEKLTERMTGSPLGVLGCVARCQLLFRVLTDSRESATLIVDVTLAARDKPLFSE